MLKIIDLNVTAGKVKLLENVNMEIKKGDFISILGKNGSGKSTLIKSILGISDGKKIDGKILWNNDVITKSIIKNHFAYIPQITKAHHGITVEEFVALSCYVNGNIFKRITPSDRKKINLAIEKVGLTEKKDSFLNVLSGGELQKTSIALGLVQERDILLFDEPTNHLDLKSTNDVYKIITELHKEGKTIVIASHDLNTSIRLSTKMAFIKDRKLFAYDDPDKLITKENIKEVFNVDAEIHLIKGKKQITTHN
ncbi:MAG: ABC transporter ATP-binding protein [Mycoplasma sp.]|nr:ABC transporter ATP-binding protein [Mycoplasma sp.]